MRHLGFHPKHVENHCSLVNSKSQTSFLITDGFLQYTAVSNICLKKYLQK